MHLRLLYSRFWYFFLPLCTMYYSRKNDYSNNYEKRSSTDLISMGNQRINEFFFSVQNILSTKGLIQSLCVCYNLFGTYTFSYIVKIDFDLRHISNFNFSQTYISGLGNLPYFMIKLTQNNKILHYFVCCYIKE